MVTTVTLALTGASGMFYGLRLLECLLAAKVKVYLLYSRTSQLVLYQETGQSWPSQPKAVANLLATRYQVSEEQLAVFADNAWHAPVASGSGVADAMVICPCSMSTLASVAGGLSNNLRLRAADVCLKERKPLLIVPRESPFSVLHLENMLKLARLGVCILPANPGFYHRPKSIEALIDFIVARILDQLGIAHQLLARWGEVGADDGANALASLLPIQQS